MDYEEDKDFSIMREKRIQYAQNAPADMDLMMKEIQTFEAMTECLTGNLNTLASMQQLLVQVRHETPRVDFHMGDGDDVFRAWVRNLGLRGKAYHHVYNRIDKLFSGDNKDERHRHHIIHDEMVYEAAQSLIWSPPLRISMSVDEIHKFISHACVMYGHLRVFHQHMSFTKEQITMQKEMYSKGIKRFRRKTWKMQRQIAYDQHLYGFGEGENMESMYTLLIIADNYSLATTSNITLIKSHRIWIHHVRRANGAGCKLYARCYDSQNVFPGSTGWFTLEQPQKHLHFMNLSDMPKKNCMYLSPFSTGTTNLTLKLHKNYLIHFNHHFRACTLEKDGPLPQVLRRFLPRQPSADDYTLLEGEESARLYREQTRKIYEAHWEELEHDRKLRDYYDNDDDDDDDDDEDDD